MMKKFVFVALAMGAMLSLPACGDDDTSFIDFPEGTAASLTAGCEDGEFVIPIMANGEWKATVMPQDAHWLSLVTTEGKGNGNVVFLVEPNTTDEYRKAQIVLNAGRQTLSYEVTQTTLSTSGEGEALNGAEMEYSMFGSNIPVGYGVYIKKANNMKRFTSNQIFRLKNLGKEELAEYLTGDYVGVDNAESEKIKLTTAKEFKEQEREIKANLSVNIQYAIFKLGLTGAFKMSGASTDTTFVYSAVTNVPRQEVYLQYQSLLSDYNDIPDNLKTYVISKSFAIIRDSIQTLVAAGKTLKDKELTDQLEKMDKNYGPVFCTDATLGGNANISITLGKAEGVDTLAVSGMLTTSFSSLFSLDVEASASYMNQASSYIENSEVDIDITGGSKEARAELIKSFGEIVKPDIDTDEINGLLIDKISTWAKSIDPTQSSTYTCTEYALTGIWELFTDDDAQQIVKDYLANVYPNQADGTSPYMVNIEEMVK